MNLIGGLWRRRDRRNRHQTCSTLTAVTVLVTPPGTRGKLDTQIPGGKQTSAPCRGQIVISPLGAEP